MIDTETQISQVAEYVESGADADGGRVGGEVLPTGEGRVVFK